jgi:quercetin 2,3-dioxygenase
MSKLWKSPARKVEQVLQGQATFDGADLQQRLDPFLMLDLSGTDNPGDDVGGFPDHPHWGLETITYMLRGRMPHHDSARHRGCRQPQPEPIVQAGPFVMNTRQEIMRAMHDFRTGLLA